MILCEAYPHPLLIHQQSMLCTYSRSDLFSYPAAVATFVVFTIAVYGNTQYNER